VAMEAAGGRPTVWATAQYLTYAPTGTVLDWEVVLAAVGKGTTQARAIGRLGDQEVLTVNAALGSPGSLDAGGVWVTAPEVPVIEAIAVSVAVTVSELAVLKVTGKLPVPAVRVPLAGKVALPSELVK